MNAYKHTQIGYWGVAILAVVLTASLWGNFTVSTAVLYGLLFLIGAVFATLTIRVSESTLQWFFGPRLWNKAIDLPDIVDMRVVRNSWWFGFGIRLTQHGWLYNVSGLQALELSLKSGKKIRLGTDEPEKLQAAITAQASS